MHSGPVTAGVLRGDRARFQLFGEVVALAALIEHTGARERIHISEKTAKMIIDAGKGEWVLPRTDKEVICPSQDNLQTFWVQTKAEQSAVSLAIGSEILADNDEVDLLPSKKEDGVRSTVERRTSSVDKKPSVVSGRTSSIKDDPMRRAHRFERGHREVWHGHRALRQEL